MSLIIKIDGTKAKLKSMIDTVVRKNGWQDTICVNCKDVPNPISQEEFFSEIIQARIFKEIAEFKSVDIRERIKSEAASAMEGITLVSEIK